MNDSQIGPRTPLPDERIEQIIREDWETAERTDEVRRAERLSGLRCSCCDEPLPASVAGDECAECAAINS